MYVIVDGYAYFVDGDTGKKVTFDVNGQMSIDATSTISITTQEQYDYDEMCKKTNVKYSVNSLRKEYILSNINDTELSNFYDNLILYAKSNKNIMKKINNIIENTVKEIENRLDDCVITFDKNGGTGSMNEVRKEVGEKYNLPSCTFTAPADKQFKEWKIGETSYDVNDEITLSTSITVKAIWEDVPQEEHVHTLQFKEKKWPTGDADVCYIEVKHCSECGQDVEFPHEHNFVEDVDTGLMQCSECQQYQVDLS